LNFQKSEEGFYYNESSVTFFFGSKNFNLNHLQKKYSGVRFSMMNQSHGDQIYVNPKIETSSEINPRESFKKFEDRPQADAQVFYGSGLGLLVLTADCLPIMIYDKVNLGISAVHAGWRGVENQIYIKTVKKMILLGSEIQNLVVCIGPHIQSQSFEVDNDVKDKIVASVHNFCSSHNQDLINESSYVSFEKNKFHLNLKEIVVQQSLALGIPQKQVHSLDLDTKSELDFHSFRREKENSGRNISFILRSTDKKV
jgi:YfiH family protein